MITSRPSYSTRLAPPRSSSSVRRALTACSFSPLVLLIGACSSDPPRDSVAESNDDSTATSPAEVSADTKGREVSSAVDQSVPTSSASTRASASAPTSAPSHRVDAGEQPSDTETTSTSSQVGVDAAATEHTTSADEHGSDAGAHDAEAGTSEVSDASLEPIADAASDSGVVVTFPDGSPLVMLVIDGSSGVFSTSLYGGSTGFGEYPDVWEAMRGVLTRLSGETNVRFWPVVYRAQQSGACPNLYLSETEPVSNNAELDGWLPSSEEAVTENKQEGPLPDALAVVIEKLLAYDHSGPKHMLFLGDGPPGDSCTFFDAPPCNRDPVFGRVQDAYRAGIRTRMLNLGEEAGLAFAEDVSHAGNGERVISLQETAYCIAQEAVKSGKIDSEDYAAQSDYITNWRDHASGEYLPDGEVYAQVLSYSPTDAASLTDAVQSYLQWLKEVP